MTYVTIYLLCAIALMIAFAVRTSDIDVSHALFWGILWPIALVLIVVFLAIDKSGWEMDIKVNNTKRFGFRRPIGGGAGFAVTIFGLEFQVWKLRKK